jgi:hypothetical protein
MHMLHCRHTTTQVLTRNTSVRVAPHLLLVMSCMHSWSGDRWQHTLLVHSIAAIQLDLCIPMFSAVFSDKPFGMNT